MKTKFRDLNTISTQGRAWPLDKLQPGGGT